MSVLAIDPGNAKSAWVVFNGKRVLDKGINDNDDVRSLIYQQDSLLVHHLAIEMVESFGMAVGKEVFETVYWIGRFVESWKGPSTRVYRKEVKIHLCGTMKAKDPNIRQALLDRFGPPGTKKQPGLTYGITKDMWSALAVAVTYWDLREVNH
jgi:hypothetical protein